MPENDRPAALIFDLDGTLAHTMPAHYFAWQRVSDEHGLGLTEDRFYATAGMPTADIVALLAAETGLTLDADVIGEQKEALFVERGLASVEPIQAVVDIARAHRGKLPMAVATSAFRWVAEKTLPQIGLADWFDALVTTEDVARGKPAPDIYLEAARRLGVEPHRCRVYEDGESGLQSARAAGMTVIDVKQLPGYPGRG